MIQNCSIELVQDLLSSCVSRPIRQNMVVLASHSGYIGVALRILIKFFIIPFTSPRSKTANDKFIWVDWLEE
jgi:hypothetical protein